MPICSQMIKFGQIILSRMVNNWLVVDQPLWKIWVRQLGWWHSQYLESHKIPWFQTTNQITMDRPIITINNLINNPERYILSLLAPENILSVGYRDRTTTQHSRDPSLMEIQPTPKFSTKKEIVWPLSLLDVGAWCAPGSHDWRIGRTKLREINGARKETWICWRGQKKQYIPYSFGLSMGEVFKKTLKKPSGFAFYAGQLQPGPSKTSGFSTISHLWQQTCLSDPVTGDIHNVLSALQCGTPRKLSWLTTRTKIHGGYN